MQLQIPKEELSQYFNEGNTVILAYRRAYIIKYSVGAKCYYLDSFHYSLDDFPLTKRGRYIATTPDHAHKIIHG